MSSFADVCPELAAVIEQDASEGIFCVGAQIAVVKDGDLFTGAWGRDAFGRPIDDDAVHFVYCAGKPVTTLAIAHLISSGMLRLDTTLDEPLGDLLPLKSSLRPVSIGELLAHRAALHAANRYGAMMVPDDQLQLAVLGARRLSIRDPAARYDEVTAWQLLRHVVEQVSGWSFPSLVQHAVLEPLGIADDVFVQPRGAARVPLEQRLRASVDLHLGRPVPHVHELDERRLRSSLHPVVASARGLARLYAGLLDILAGERVEPCDASVLTSLLTPVGARGYDPVMGRECRYSSGFMIELADHIYGEAVSDEAFGYSGYAGMTSAFADPVEDVSVSLHYNGAIDGESSLRFRRRARFNMLYKELAAMRADPITRAGAR